MCSRRNHHKNSRFIRFGRWFL
ncbi:MAG: hypothetical protein E7064_00870 [Spirochaetaceae bacterium]|nr:hypothetical protein [Spirochaetaceae bacterium]